ncbi:MAG: mercury transporter, partial [Chitinophagaceae bacterium]
MIRSIVFLASVFGLSITTSQAQINNAKTETIKVYGNCEMCEASIEKAATSKKISK